MIVVVPPDMLPGIGASHHDWLRVILRLEIQRRIQTGEPESGAFAERLRELAK